MLFYPYGEPIWMTLITMLDVQFASFKSEV